MEYLPLRSYLNDATGDKRFIPFLNVDWKKTYCPYKAPNVEAIREAARQPGLPADSVVEVDELLLIGLSGSVKVERSAPS